NEDPSQFLAKLRCLSWGVESSRLTAGSVKLSKQVFIALKLSVQGAERRIIQLEGQRSRQTKLEFKLVQRLQILQLITQERTAPVVNLLLKLIYLQLRDIASFGHGLG